MANYYLNNDGTTSVRKKGKGKNYILQDNGKVIENKIANNTVKKKKKIEKNDKSFLESVGDFGLGALKTVGNIATNMGEGTLRRGEGILDTLSSWSDKINNPLTEKAEVLTGVSTKEEAKKNRKATEKGTREFIERDLTTEFQDKVGFTDIKNDWEKDSLVTSENLGGQIAQGIGGMVPSLVAGQYLGIGPVNNTSTKGMSISNKILTSAKNIGKKQIANLGSNTAMAAGSYGQALQEAYQNGATEEEAKKYALGSSATELATEWITGGIPGLEGTGIIDKTAKNFINKSTGKVKNSVLKGIKKTLLNAGYEIVGEGFEEGLSELVSPLLKNATYSENEEINWKDVFQSAIVGGITGGILNLPSTAVDFTTNINEGIREQKAKKTANDTEDVVSGDNNSTLNANVMPSANQNKVAIDNTENTIDGNPLLNNNLVSTMPSAVQNNSAISNVETLSNISNNNLNDNTLSLPQNLPFSAQNIENNANVQELVNTPQNSVLYNENLSNQNEQPYKYIKSTNGKIDSLRQSATQYFNNSQEIRDFVDVAEKVIKDKDYNIVFDNTLSSDPNKMVNAQIRILDNGETEIRLNPNSSRSGEFLLTHEITHAIENQDMVNLVMDYASKNQEFNSALESLKETYGVDDVNDEVLADISGQLFGNQEFINKLSMQKPNIFKRIYDTIISLANKITGNSRESLFIRDLKNKWEKAYRTQENDLSDTKFMITGIKGTKSLEKLNKTNVLTENYKEALDMDKKGISKKSIREYTGWYKDINGDWKFEISDQSLKINKKLKKNYNYILEDVLSHNYLYKMYPKARKIKVKFKDMETNHYGAYNKVTGTIEINNSLLSNINKLEETLLHEIQHYIQKKEGFQGGTYIGKDFEKYKNNFGETEAREVYKRKSMSFDKRMKYPSETQLYNNESKNKLYTKADIRRYNIFKGDLYVQETQKNNKDNILQNRLGGQKSLIELDNSSFSFDKDKIKLTDEKITEEDVDEARRIFLEYKDEYGFDDTTKELQRKYNKLETKYKKQTNQIKDGNNKLNMDDEAIDDIVRDITNIINQGTDIVYENDIDEAMQNIPTIKELFEINEDFDEFKDTYNKFYDKIIEKLNNDGISARYDKSKDRMVYDRQESAIKGYSELLDYLDDNNVNYEISRSTEAGYVPSIYIKNADGDTVYRIANHDNGYIDDYDMTYNDVYNTLFSDKDYVNWKEKIVPKIEKEIGSLNNQNTKYSKENGSWQEFIEKNFKSRGTKSYFKDMKLKESKNVEQDLRNEEIKKINNKYDKLKKSKQKIMTKEASKILQFSDYKTKQKFQDLISEYYDNPDYNKIRQDILENFSEQKIEYVNDELYEIKRNIRSTDLKVDDYIKKNLTDYSFFRKSNFNKLKLKNEGQSIDSFYTELSDMYPSIFSKDITNEVDQLHRLSEFMNEDNTLIEKYKLDDRAIDEATKYIYDSLKDNVNIDDIINSINISPKEIRREKTNQYREEAEDFVKDSFNWKDKKSGLAYKINTMKRNFYDIMPKKDAVRLYTNYIEPIFKHNADMQKDIKIYNKRIEKLKLNDKESTAVQMLGEYKYNPETLLTGFQIDEFISKNKLDYDKISNAVEEFRGLYDELYDRVNTVLKSQGYKEVDYRKGYFPHFIDDKPTGIVGKIAEKLGWKFKNNDLPTSIAGITDQFKPGKVWTSFSQQRKGKITDYNALKGFDNYIRGAMQDIYFTEDIQKLRALENEIRYQHSDKGVQSKIDEIYDDASLSFEDRQDKIEKIYATYITPLNNFVTELRDYTNGIANKKSGLDRTVEALSNRKFYNVMENVSSRLSANMVGMNLGSAITNFIPITQAASQVKSKYLLKGLREAIKNQYSADGFDNKSVFLTSRLNEADRLYKTKLEKVSEKMNFMFDGIDSITSNTIVRAKYYENKAKGMSEFNAMRNADEFARDLMAGRTKGEMPTAFNSKNPLVKMLTSFQLEVNNQFGYMLKDLPRDLGDEAKKKLIAAFVKMFIGAWIYNQLTENVVGRKSSFSPIDTIKEIYDTATNDNLKITDKSADILENLTQDIPFFGGLVGGGRLPISSVANPFSVLRGESTAKDELKKLGYYTILPFGGGQAKKMIEGASMYINKKEIKGSYNKKGELRFEAETDPLAIAQNVLFGQYSSKNAQEYFDKSYMPISKKTMDRLKKENISISQYREYEDNYKSIKTEQGKKITEIKASKNEEGKPISGSASAKKAYLIMNSNFSKKDKNYMLSKISNFKNSADVKTLKKLENKKKAFELYYSMNKDNRENFINELDEYDISVNKLTDYYSKRSKINKDYTSGKAKEKLIDYITNSNLNDDTKWYLYSKDYGSDNLDLQRRIFNIKSRDYFNVIKYKNSTENKYSGKDANKKRKRDVFNYINSLSASTAQKIVLFNQVGYSDSSHKNYMFQYINSLPISKAEKNKIWKTIY